MAEAQNQQDLRRFVPETWLADDRFQSALFRIYSSPLGQLTHLHRSLGALAKIADLIAPHPLELVIIETHVENEFLTTDFVELFQPIGRVFHAKVGKKKIPPGYYIAIVSPFGPRSEHLAAESAEICRGVISSVLGHSSASSLSIELRLDLRADGNGSHVSPVIENHVQPSTHAFMNVDTAHTLIGRIQANLYPETKHRFQTAFRFLGLATGVVDSTVRFANSWIALEVATGSRGKAVDALKAVSTTDPAVSISRLKGARDALFHNGTAYTMSQAEEILIKAAIVHALGQQFNLDNLVSKVSPE